MKVKNFPVDRKLMHEINQNSLLNLIRTHAPVSRAMLATLSGLSPATIIGITNELIEGNIVKESGVAESMTRGPKPVLLEIQPDGRYAIGIKVTESDVFGIVLNLHGDVVHSEHLSIVTGKNQQQFLSSLVLGVRDLIEHSGLTKEKIIGVGCGIPGLIDADRGCCVLSWHLGLHNIQIREPLEEALELPVFIDNDVSCLAIYEKLFGHGQRYHDFVTVTIGSGIGMGVVINGDLYRGAGGGSGEFGHIAVVDGGRLCACGKLGCLEAYASDYGIVENYREALHGASSPEVESITSATLLELAREGKQEARIAFERAGYYLGLGLATMVNLFNPECVIFSGPSVGSVEIWFPVMKQELRRNALGPLVEHLQIECEPLKYADWARGAASLALRQFFLPPSTRQDFTLKNS